MGLIDVDKLKETIWNNVCYLQDVFTFQGYGVFLTGGIEKVIDEQPIIEAEPIRHGHWINDEGLYKCSVCNNFATIAGYANCIPIEQMNKTMKYCNSCGAKMDEVNDETKTG